MPAETQPTKNRALLIALVAGVFALVAVGVAMLLVNISEKKSEARFSYVRVVEVGEDDTDPAKWGKNWPREFDDYKRTAERTSTKYGGAIGTAEGEMAPQKAERDPWLKRVFAGYLFAVDYRDRRGHAFMLKDQEITKRNVPGEGKQSGNCLHCHGSIMPLYRKLGKEAAPQGSPAEQLQAGLAKVAEMGYWDAHKALEDMGGGKAHPVSCVDCHDPASMEVRVSRPGFIAGIQKLAAGSAEVPHLPSIDRWRKGDRSKPYDPNLDSTRQERRAYVCGQCHVEYFCGKGMTLLFPWAEGLKVENAEHLYDNLQVKGQRFKDWVHAETGFEVLKAQHPEFEVWSQGIHARSGVTCADCHMPYKREGAQKYSDHWVRSPLLQPNRACATCHPLTDDELKARVLAIQDRHFALLTRAGNAAVAMIDAIVAVRKPYDERNLAAATAKAKETLAKQDAFQKLPKEDQDKKMGAEVKANLLASWREVIAKTPALQELENLQRAAQWRLDFVAAENSMGFHAPQELARILGESIDLSREAEVKATRLAVGTAASAAAVPATQRR
ncbi:ammonia-forming cytochrome c nitrite reductase subunit c552 [Anaeromyxobacter dehalogenans]|uniref:nitrite reductase (cytochrome; ammonia-forming) n=1 Tax=Anaeromyxobacter dehalogenans (strain 2CP-C) TaxID=290397 RepID=Q2IDL0_ANADE|nr:ammonia-forming cytochrome c nitrite reductase subunit c552 [Anaeromyxobacter dehalogenans]ABC82672.1 respiratory nitrite reductase (cytochrome; ammonia-forming) precursor [Anaeromyxobacter dehalogenans 2CP-C]